MSHKPVIHWFRRDLRLTDNLAFHAAAKSNTPIIPLFIFDDKILSNQSISVNRLHFLLEALKSLNKSLRTLGSQLIIKRGDPERIISQFVESVDAHALYFNRDYSPYAIKRDEATADALTIEVNLYDDALLMPPGTVMSNSGTPYTVFTPFKKKWNTYEKPATSELTLTQEHFHNLDGVSSEPIPELSDFGFSQIVDLPPADEAIAQEKLARFTDKDIQQYSDLRNRLAINPFDEEREKGSSYLSPYFRLGLLSPRQAYWAAREAYQSTSNKESRESIATWVSELTWREFYMHILHHFPHVHRGNFRAEYDALEWRDAPNELQAWKDGRTGYPIVDAAMRQLQQIGWMPNRARMIVASFLTKDLLIHWREGEAHFMQHLLDGDPAANNGGWQWAAGTGTDAQPYFRIFNPVSQSKKFDPDGEYIRHWVPELADVPKNYIHAPWEMDKPPADYPPPIVDHKAARERTLAAFKAIKGG